MSFDAESILPPGARIKVIGVGGGGGNAINTMIRDNLEGVEFVAANTDVQALRFSLAPDKIQLGRELTKGLGAGADPDIGRDAALEDRHALQEALDGADMVFITAGMGGGTGTGGASVIAQIARDLGALTVGVVTKPFTFEGKRRQRQCELGIQRLREHVDTLITIPNQRLLQVASPDTSMIEAFRMADNVLLNAVRGISDIINVPGTVNVDFADVKTVMSSMGLALMGIGQSSGEQRALEAARQAICSPLLEDVDIEGATGILINITAGSNVTLMEVNEACSVIQDAAHEDANIIFGAVIDESVGNEIRVTVIATGFPSEDDAALEIPSRRPLFHRSHASEAVATFAPIQRQQPAQVVAKPEPVKEEPPIQAAAPESPAPELKLEASVPEPQPHASEEAHDLTRWTMNEVDDESEGSELSDADELFQPITVQPTDMGKTLQGATAASDLDDNELLDDDDALDGTRAPNLEEAPLEPLFREHSASEEQSFEKKIDEAMELAKKLKADESEPTEREDNLEIPAFLRNLDSDSNSLD